MIFSAWVPKHHGDGGDLQAETRKMNSRPWQTERSVNLQENYTLAKISIITMTSLLQG